MDKYLQALSKYSELNELTWIVSHLDLYKTTLIWPDDLPPLATYGMNKFKQSFHDFYKEHLNNYEYELINNERILKIKTTANNV